LIQYYEMKNTGIFKTVANPSTGIFKDKGSKFLSFVFPVSTEQEIKEILVKIKKMHHGARHYCYAWLLGPEMENFRINDDGEPSGTAGRPIFGQIQSRDLTNILIIVVRYFGGILLGTSGLLNAYKQATIDALNKSEITEKFIEDLIEVYFDYQVMNEFMSIVKEMQLEIIRSDFNLNCSVTIAVRRSLSENILENLKKIDNLKASIIGINNN
jgi:uncharacterized YigZ family protein